MAQPALSHDSIATLKLNKTASSGSQMATCGADARHSSKTWFPTFSIVKSNISHGALVLSCTPCHPFMRSPSTPFTIRCCCNMLFPENRSDTTWIAYMEPHPPETSRTSSAAGANSEASLSHICDSAASRSSGFWRAVEAGFEGGDEELASLVVVVEYGRRRAGIAYALWEIEAAGMEGQSPISLRTLCGSCEA